MLEEICTEYAEFLDHLTLYPRIIRLEKEEYESEELEKLVSEKINNKKYIG